EQHAAECGECSRALAAVRRTDRQLMALFADVRPGPTFEDRLIRTLRRPQQPVRRRFVSGPWIKAVLATAAVALMATVGAVVTMAPEHKYHLKINDKQQGLGMADGDMPMAERVDKALPLPDGRVPLGGMPKLPAGGSYLNLPRQSGGSSASGSGKGQEKGNDGGKVQFAPVTGMGVESKRKEESFKEVGNTNQVPGVPPPPPEE